jgi:uncharacterized protein (TIGR02231 family)
MSTTIVADIPVDEVTVLEDRAQVTRRGRLRVEPGRRRVRIDGVAPVLVDKSLVARVESGAGRAVDVRVERAQVVLDADKPQDVAALDATIRALASERETLADRISRLETRRVLLEQAARLAAAEAADDAAWDRFDPARVDADLDAASAATGALRRELVELKHESQRLEQQGRDLAARRAAVDSPSTVFAARVFVELDATEAGELVLAVEYVVPAAAWRPYHRARRIAGTPERLELRTDACVWQCTGEAWTQARLSFSTERPSLGARPPSLAADRLRAQKRAPQVTVEARETAIQTTGLGAGQKKLMPEVPGIDDGGMARHLVARARATVPSDGRPHRLPLSTIETPVKLERVLMGELEPLVIERTEQTNEGSQPLLPGPVDLIRNGGLVGRTSLRFVAPGERFELGWGPVPELRVTREVEKHEEKSKLLSSWVEVPHRVKLLVSNIGDQRAELRITERVPVSEVEKVKIELDPKKTTDRASPDEDGMVKWTITVPPFGRATVELAYTLKRHQDIAGL